MKIRKNDGREGRKLSRKIGAVCIAAGILLILAAAGLALHNYMEEKRAEESSDAIMTELAQEMEDLETGSLPEIDGYTYIGYLSIPALGLELPVMEDWDYTRLSYAPCRYYGSVETGDMVIAGHNFDCHFGRLSQLNKGDSVRFTDVEGHVTDYTVADIETLQPAAIEEMIDSGWPLTLFTCTYGGASRVTVRCRR